MNRRIVFALLFTSFFFALTLTSVQIVKADSNDYISFSSGITVYSPIEKICNSNSITLNLTLYSAGSIGSIDSRISMNYSIDGTNFNHVTLTVSNPGTHIITNAKALVNLPELSEGKHSLTIYLWGYNQRTYQPQFLSYVNTVNFAIDSDSPKILMLSPENNATYSATSIPMDFTLNEPATNVTYTLDGNKTILLFENTTLTELSAGEHNLTVTAMDATGNIGNSQTVQFTITTPTLTPLPPTSQPAQATQSFTATVAVIALVIVAVGFIIGIFAYLGFRKRKHRDA